MSYKRPYAGYYIETNTGWTIEKQYGSGFWLAANDEDVYHARTLKEAKAWLEG